MQNGTETTQTTPDPMPQNDDYCEDCGVTGEGETFVMCDDGVLRCWECYKGYMRVDEDRAAMRDYEIYGDPKEG